MIHFIILGILFLSSKTIDCSELHGHISVGGCVVPQTPQHSLAASSARMCAFLCSQLRRPCIAWSHRAGVCNMSDSLQTASLTNDTDCQAWSALRQLGLVAFWPMSNATRTRNAVSNSGHLDLQENIPMQYTDSAINFTGQSGVSERFNIDELTSVCLRNFTISMWIKVNDPDCRPMPLFEGLVLPVEYLTRIWLYPDCSTMEFTVFSPETHTKSGQPINHTGDWTHIASVYDMTIPTTTLYINGTAVNTTTSVASTVNSCVNFGSTVLIGAIVRSTPHNRVFLGQMRCFSVSARALGVDEVTQMMQIC